MNRPVVIGVMGGGQASSKAVEAAYRLGKRIAEQGWVLLNGGRNAGIMAASAQGASEVGGLTVGILPDGDDRFASPHIQIPIITDMGSARNCINVLSSRVVVACAGGAGTLSEIALAIKFGKPVILFNFEVKDFFLPRTPGARIFDADTPEAVIDRIRSLLKE
ncbi:MAG: TIGR00725 family protein [Thermodesulfobacteriota bacterium]